ncbi:MAG: hypothetical protein QM538_05760 [Methylacidiphilales bacterium]|nr:hypothetical protein [Candidatus Methylacidiphilales bacterium]
MHNVNKLNNLKQVMLISIGIFLLQAYQSSQANEDLSGGYVAVVADFYKPISFSSGGYQTVSGISYPFLAKTEIQTKNTFSIGAGYLYVMDKGFSIGGEVNYIPNLTIEAKSVATVTTTINNRTTTTTGSSTTNVTGSNFSASMLLGYSFDDGTAILVNLKLKNNYKLGDNTSVDDKELSLEARIALDSDANHFIRINLNPFFGTYANSKGNISEEDCLKSYTCSSVERQFAIGYQYRF